MFEAFGVRAETELAYRVLLRRRDLAAPVDRRTLGVPAEIAGAVWEEMVRVGLLAEEERGWVVVPPELAVEALSARAEAELEARRQAIEQARTGIAAAVSDLVDSHRELATTVTEVVRGGDAVRARLHQLTQDVTEHVWSINPGEAPPPRALEASRIMDRALRARQLRQRAVVADLALVDPAFVAYLHEAVAAGDQVRRHAAPPTRLLLFDDHTAVVPLIEDRTDQGALIVHEPGLLAPLVALFEQTWAGGMPLDPALPDADDPQAVRLRHVVALLINGQSDAAIARQLDVSSRTVGRLIAEAARRLQARSRIEMCVLALQAGWVTDQPAPAGRRRR